MLNGGPFGIFYIHCVAKCRNKQMKGGPFGGGTQSKKFQKSRIVPKKSGAVVSSFCFGRAFEVRSC